LTVAAVGVLVCVIGGTVVYSALQDTARTGTNSAESAALAASADIQLASAGKGPGGVIQCDAFSEDLSSPVLTVADYKPGDQNTRFFCVKNIGSQQVSLSVLADELTDIDFACTGDEAANGDATCGGDQIGELSAALMDQVRTVDCATGAPILTGSQHKLAAHATTPDALGTVAVNATACIDLFFFYPNGLADEAVQTAQSDRVTWRFKFSAQA